MPSEAGAGCEEASGYRRCSERDADEGGNAALDED